MARTRASDFEDKQKAILESAAAVFAEMGMDKASMALVAQHSKVSKALLYHYYPSKDALIFDIIRSHLAEVATAVEAADDASLLPKDRLKALVLAVLKTYEGADNHHKVQLNATSALTDEQKAEIRSYERQIVKRFSNVLREINPKIDSKERPLLMPVTMSLFGMMNWVYLWFRDDGPITREDYAQIATTLMLAGIMEVR